VCGVVAPPGCRRDEAAQLDAEAAALFGASLALRRGAVAPDALRRLLVGADAWSVDTQAAGGFVGDWGHDVKAPGGTKVAALASVPAADDASAAAAALRLALYTFVAVDSAEAAPARRTAAGAALPRRLDVMGDAFLRAPPADKRAALEAKYAEVRSRADDAAARLRRSPSFLGRAALDERVLRGVATELGIPPTQIFSC
jgi:hypothetical protein